jgi:hypothetical protein
MVEGIRDGASGCRSTSRPCLGYSFIDVRRLAVVFSVSNRPLITVSLAVNSCAMKRRLTALSSAVFS